MITWTLMLPTSRCWSPSMSAPYDARPALIYGPGGRADESASLA
jgi:hypothetical protein